MDTLSLSLSLRKTRRLLGLAALVGAGLLLASEALAGYRWPRDGRRTGQDGFDYFIDRSGEPSERLPDDTDGDGFVSDPDSGAAVGRDPETRRWIVRPVPGVCTKLALHPQGDQVDVAEAATYLGLWALAQGGDVSVRVSLVGSDGDGNPDMNDPAGIEILARTIYGDGERVWVHEMLYEPTIANCHWIVVEVDDPSDPCTGDQPGDGGGDFGGDDWPPDGDEWPPWLPPTTPPIEVPEEDPPLFSFSSELFCPLFSHILVTPDDNEFVILFNPNEFPIPLEEFYVANTNTYFYLPEKVRSAATTRALGGSDGVFNSRFPADSAIGPFEYQTIALTGSGFFLNLSGSGCPDYELFDDGDDDCPDTQVMREGFTGGINDQGSLPDADGHLALYWWDTEEPMGGEAPDLVNDCDLINWGDDSSVRPDKSGVSLDGPDADSTDSTYYDETAVTDQDSIDPAPHADDSLFVRIDFSEGTENQNDPFTVLYNGWLLQDETSENLDDTWGTATLPDPLEVGAGDDDSDDTDDSADDDTAADDDDTSADDDDTGAADEGDGGGGCSLIR